MFKVTNKILQIGGDTFPSDNQKVNEGEFANGEVLKKLPGYITTQLWASNNKLTKKDIASGFNSFVDFVDFSGHGSWGSWATHATQDEEVWLPAVCFRQPPAGRFGDTKKLESELHPRPLPPERPHLPGERPTKLEDPIVT